MGQESHLLKPAEVAERLRVSLKTLEGWRRRGTGPVFIRLGGRDVRYPEADLVAWIVANRSDAGERGPSDGQ
jgi:predicted DNA-binding transcriptional regulator AlpA